MASSKETADPLDLAAWSHERIKAECRREHSRYKRALEAHYTNYFSEHRDLASDDHRYMAKGLSEALPVEWDELAELLPPSSRHPSHLSGGSSQILGLALIGAARKCDPSASWLWQALTPRLPPSDSPGIKLEQELPESVLNERPRTTAVDVLVEDEQMLTCIEMKWWEGGFDPCSCSGDGPQIADCSKRVLGRWRYWAAAEEVLGLPPRQEGRECPVSWTYQPTRNIAAAIKLAGARQPAFALIYDANNPYFGGHGNWPGWPKLLDRAINGGDSGVRFASTSWQELTPIICQLDGMEAVCEWAQVKHGLPV